MLKTYMAQDPILLLALQSQSSKPSDNIFSTYVQSLHAGKTDELLKSEDFRKRITKNQNEKCEKLGRGPELLKYLCEPSLPSFSPDFFATHIFPKIKDKFGEKVGQDYAKYFTRRNFCKIDRDGFNRYTANNQSASDSKFETLINPTFVGNSDISAMAKTKLRADQAERNVTAEAKADKKEKKAKKKQTAEEDKPATIRTAYEAFNHSLCTNIFNPACGTPASTPCTDHDALRTHATRESQTFFTPLILEYHHAGTGPVTEEEKRANKLAFVKDVLSPEEQAGKSDDALIARFDEVLTSTIGHRPDQLLRYTMNGLPAREGAANARYEQGQSLIAMNALFVHHPPAATGADATPSAGSWAPKSFQDIVDRAFTPETGDSENPSVMANYLLYGQTSDEEALRTAGPGDVGITSTGYTRFSPPETLVIGPTNPPPPPPGVVTTGVGSGESAGISRLGGSLAERGITQKAPVIAADSGFNLDPGPSSNPTPAVVPTNTPTTNGDAARLREEIERLKRERDALNNNKVVKVGPTPGPTPIPVVAATPTAVPESRNDRARPAAVPQGPQRLAGGGGGSNLRSATSASRNPASVSSGGSQSGSLDGFAGKMKNARYKFPVEPFDGKPGGLPGIKELKAHLPYESPWIVPYELIDLFGIKKVVMYFRLEGKTFSALKVLGENEYQIIVYAFNPRGLSKKELESLQEIDRRMRVKRLIEDMRVTPEEEAKNAGAFSTAADNTQELVKELLLTERDRKAALKQMLPQDRLDKAWSDLRDFVVPKADVLEE